MKNWDCIFDAISKATGTKFSGAHLRPIGSDKVSDTQIISDGHEEYFIKRAAADAVQRLAAEVEGLEALRKVNALTVPRVIVSGLAGSWSYIVLDYALPRQLTTVRRNWAFNWPASIASPMKPLAGITTTSSVEIRS